MEFYVQTSKNKEIIDITRQVEQVVAKGKVSEGFCLVYATHATAAIILNEYEPNIERDYLKWFDQFFPKGNWAHNRIDDNAEAHLKSALIGSARTIPITSGRLDRGTWQSVMLCEFDGPRKRRVVVKLVGEK